MNISKKKIRSITRHLPGLEEGKKIRVSVVINENEKVALNRVGFPDQLIAGQTLVPMGIGPFTSFNVNGRDLKRTDLPKEPKDYTIYTSWNDWHGDPHSGVQYRNVMAYPVEHIYGPTEQFTVVEKDGQMLVVSSVLENVKSAETVNLHVINLFLEVFGHCTILDEGINMIALPELRTLNWKVMPKGKYPWNKARNHVQNVTKLLPEDKKQIVEYRLEQISKYNPDFLAVGQGGFSGYFVMGFELLGIYIFESIHLGNATYVFEKNWESASKLTKKQILDKGLHKERVIHTRAWYKRIRKAALGF